MNSIYKFVSGDRIVAFSLALCYKTSEATRAEAKKARIRLGDSLAFGGKSLASAEFIGVDYAEGEHGEKWESPRVVRAKVPLVGGRTARVLCFRLPKCKTWTACVSFDGLNEFYCAYPYWVMTRARSARGIIEAALERIRDDYMGK